MDREAIALSARPSHVASRRTHRALATMATGLSLLAALAGDPRRIVGSGTGPSTADDEKGNANCAPPLASRDATIACLAALAEQIATEKDHVTALDLAQWIRDQKNGLRVIDVRTADERTEGAIPTSEPVDLATLMATAFRQDDTIVVYSAEGIHAGQAWVLLRALGRRSVFFLRGGWAAWHDEVMHPTLEEGSAGDAQAAFARAATLSRYFGGTPRIVTGQPRPIVAPTDGKSEPSPGPAARRPRGC